VHLGNAEANEEDGYAAGCTTAASLAISFLQEPSSAYTAGAEVAHHYGLKEVIRAYKKATSFLEFAGTITRKQPNSLPKVRGGTK